MAIPNPPFDLAGHCSAIYNNTLFIYSPAGFTSLPLSQNATWSTLPAGVSVTGSQCVKAEPADSTQDAFYVIGGTASAAAAATYPGLQRYMFKTGKWETITPQVSVTQTRLGHGATYLKGTNSLFMYAGTQGAGTSGQSSQTFLISTLPPYQVLSFNSAAPPLAAPVVMPLSDTSAMMIGGVPSPGSKAIYTWTQAAGWTTLSTTLQAPLISQSAIKCSLVTGDDGSKVLEEYNMGSVPNSVERYVILTADGKPAAPGQTVGRKRKRALALNDWPAYNSTLAPSIARGADYSIAESSDGLAVISGGSTVEPIAVFDQKANSWVNATTLLGRAEQIPLTPSTTSSASLSSPTVSPNNSTSSSTISSAPSATSSAPAIIAASTDNDTSARTARVLGGTLGTVLGLGALLFVCLWLMRCIKRRKTQRGQNYLNEKDDRLSFADQGAEFMPQAGGSVGRHFSMAPDRSSKGSLTSLTIFTKGAKKYGHRSVPSDASNLGLVKHAKSPLGAADPLEMAQMEKEAQLSPTFGPLGKGDGPPPKARSLAPKSATPSRSRSRGWSRYFTNNDVTDLAAAQPSRSLFSRKSAANTNRSSVISGSDYGEVTRVFSSTSTVRPLELNLGPVFDGQRLSTVSTGSPVLENPNFDLRGHTAEIGQTSLIPGALNTARYTTNTNPFAVSPLITDNHKSFSKPPKPIDSDARSISSLGSTNQNPYFAAGTNPYHMNDQTRDYYPKTPKTPTTPASAYGDARKSDLSGSTVFPRSNSNAGPLTSAMKNSSSAQSKVSTPEAFDFPLPKAYFAHDNMPRDSNGSNVTLFPKGYSETPQVQSPAIVQQPAPVAKPKVVQVRGTSPTNEGVRTKVGLPAGPGSLKKKGPVIRKMTGDEDMSWLNIGSG